MGTLKLIKENGQCVVQSKNDGIHDIMIDTAILIGGLIASTGVSRETWLEWFRSEEFEDIIIDMADAEYRNMKGGDRHKKKSSSNRRRRSDFGR